MLSEYIEGKEFVDPEKVINLDNEDNNSQEDKEDNNPQEDNEDDEKFTTDEKKADFTMESEYFIKDPFKDAHRRPLKNFKFANFSDCILDLNTGKYTFQKDSKQDSKQDSKGREMSIPQPIMNLNPAARKRYFLMYAVTKRRLGSDFNRDKGYLLESALFHIDVLKFNHECPSLLTPEQFVSAPETITFFLWKAFPDLTTKVIFKSDVVTSSAIYVYTQSNPTYIELTDVQSVNFFKSFLEILFANNIPENFSNTSYFVRLKNYISVELALSEDEFAKKYITAGCPFSNVYARVIYGNPDVIQLPYDENLFNEIEPIPYEYEIPKFEGNLIMLTKNVKNFLDVLASTSKYNYCVIRGFIRNCITANQDGSHWQTCLWIFGPGNTGKSLLISLLKTLLGEKYVAEFSKHQNQFSNNALRKAKLLVVSDLEVITPQQKEALKAVMGRDTLVLQEKYKKHEIFINPYGQIVFVSNRPPSDFTELITDQAVLDKLIILEYKEEDRIPPEYQIADLSKRLAPLIPEIFNWALYAPRELQDFYIRAISYNDYRKSIIKEVNRGIHLLLKHVLLIKEGLFYL